MTYVAIALVVILLAFIFMKGSGAAANGNFENITPAEAKKMLNDKNVVALDVRTPAEVSQGKIKNAVAINVASSGFLREINKLDKSKTYIVYCRSGRRSMNASRIMSSKGFENIYNLLGGYNNW